MDKNNDGTVEKIEVRQFNQGKDLRIDANNDVQARSQVNTAKEAKMDANNDGIVDQVEADQFKQNKIIRRRKNKL